MSTFKTFLALAAIATLSSACSSSGETSKRVQALQNKDKQLTCKEILLEMNEAEFYKGMASKNKDPKLKYMLMPLGYISTYMDAEEAIDASNARVSYLNKIYEISNCDAIQNQNAIPVNYPQQAQPQQYYSAQPVMQMPQVRYQVQPQVMAPMHPQSAAMPVFEENSAMNVPTGYPNGYAAY